MSKVIVFLLFLFRGSNEYTPAIKLSDSLSDLFSCRELPLTDLFAGWVPVNSLVKLEGQFSAFALNFEVWKNQFENEERMSCGSAPIPNWFCRQWASCPNFDMAFQFFMNEEDHSFAGIGQGQHYPVGASCATCFVYGDADTPFSIKEAGDVSLICKAQGDIMFYSSPYFKSFASKSSDHSRVRNSVNSSNLTRRFTAPVQKRDFRPIQMRHFEGAFDRDLSAPETRKDALNRNVEFLRDAICRPCSVKSDGLIPFVFGKSSMDFSVIVNYDASSHGALLLKEGLWLEIGACISRSRSRFILNAENREVNS